MFLGVGGLECGERERKEGTERKKFGDSKEAIWTRDPTAILIGG